MKAILMSSRPEHCKLIACGEKTIEVRKSRPKISTPFKVYIYQTLPKYGDINDKQGRIIGEFICDEIQEFAADYCMDENQTERISNLSQIKMSDLMEYGYYAQCLYAWHMSDIIIYGNAKELSEMRVIDSFAVKTCQYRARFGKPEYKTRHGGWIKAHTDVQDLMR